MEATGGSSDAAGRLIELVYDQLRALAANALNRHAGNRTLQPTALVHEFYLRVADHPADAWCDREHFLAIAAQAMRQIVIDHARRRGAAKRGGDWKRISIDLAVERGTRSEIDLLALNDALSNLERLNERQARIVEMRFFGGLTNAEVARFMDLSEETVKRDWRMARAWLMRELDQGDAQ